jgi:ribosomal subunit interface protein
MRTLITARAVPIPDALKERSGVLLARLSRLAHRPTSAQVTFGTAHQRMTVEIVLKAARNAVFVAGAEAADHRTALDRAAAKIRRQLDKALTAPRRRARKAVSR